MRDPIQRHLPDVSHHSGRGNSKGDRLLHILLERTAFYYIYERARTTVGYLLYSLFLTFLVYFIEERKSTHTFESRARVGARRARDRVHRDGYFFSTHGKRHKADAQWC